MNTEFTMNNMRNRKANNTIPADEVSVGVPKSIDEMTNWDILNYLREEREWMVLPAYTRDDYYRNFDLKFKDSEEWDDFTTKMCDCWDNIISETIGAMVEAFGELGETH